MKNNLRTSDFDYHLPEELVAQKPITRRDTSNLLVVDRAAQNISHHKFFDIEKYLKPGDLLVLNNTKVIPARLFGVKEGGGDKTARGASTSAAQIEVLLLHEVDKNTWNCLVRPGKRLKIGSKVIFAEGKLSAEVLKKNSDGSQTLRFDSSGEFKNLLEKLGKIPLPPYIKKTQSVSSKSNLGKRYQTVFAAVEGASAAPTAGLHFTDKLLRRLKKKGVKIAHVTLHTGLATFRPVYTDYIRDHKMHSEYFEVEQECIEALRRARDGGSRVVAVGTTVVRTLETLARRKKLEPCFGDTDLFITPGFKFKLIDALITNFHLPRSTLLMLVSAFVGVKARDLSGRDLLLSAYEEAKNRKYRFFSFGDAMLIV